MAMNLTRLTASAATDCAATRLPYVASAADLPTVAAANNMRPVTRAGGRAYEAADGSWIGVDASGRLQRGIGDSYFSGRYLRTRPSAASSTGNSFTPMRDTSRPGLPRSLRGHGIANVGIVNARTPASHFQSHGFTHDGRSTWVHPDGSWVNTQPLSVGWKGYALNELPYSRAGGWA